MAEIHDLITRIGHDAARDQVPADRLGGLDPALPRDRRQIAVITGEWQRQVDWAADIMSREQLRRNWLHGGFCMVALPHTKPARNNAPFALRNGDFKLILSPKPVDIDDAGEPVYAGLPYGSKARLILVYLQTYAVRHRTKTIVLGDSMTAWIRRLGFENVSGGERGVITAVNEQARRISRCEFTMIWDRGNRRQLADQPLVRGLEMFADRDGDGDGTQQLSLLTDIEAPRRRRRYSWVREIELSDEFYAHLTEHRVVLAEEAIAKLKGSSWALDLYLWLCYRLRTVEAETPPITWAQLREQFCPMSYASNLSVFRSKVLEPALRDVQAVYPEANIRITDRGVILLPSSPPLPKVG